MPVKKSKKLKELPNEIIIIPNEDKYFHETWTPGRNLLNIPHPFRCMLIGPPNSGKTLLIKNILLRAKPIFKKIYVVHCDGDFTKEYEDVDATMLDSIPSPEEWEGDKKTMVVLDDIDYKGMNKVQAKNLNRLFGFASTHKNISVCLTSQNYFDIPTSIRRMANFFILWKTIDSDSFKMIAKKTGMKIEQFQYIFKNIIGDDKHSSLWIDLTSKTSAKLRKNGYQVIKTEGDDFIF